MSTKNKLEENMLKLSFENTDYAVDYMEDDVVDYVEDEVVDFAEDDLINFVEDDVADGAEEGIIAEIFSEEEFEEDSEDISRDMTLKEVLDQMNEGDAGFKGLSEELEQIGEELEDIAEENPDVTVGDLIPGTNVSSGEFDEDESEEVETDYLNDNDLSKFMEYINGQYPSMIPSHDGRTTVGCERAISFLDRLNSQISKAIKEDVDGVLDLLELENVRANIMRDVIKLKQHLGNLKKKLKESNAGEKTDIPLWKNSEGKEVPVSDISKKASVPNNMVICVTPFQRAITGMMINAHVSSGKPMADVFEALKKKYDITEREELEIVQICMDSGFPMFKDRGTVGSEDEGSAIDFIKNYFA